MDTGQSHNPFSSHFVEPAAGGYLFSSPNDFQALLQQLRSTDWRGELVANHGAGKSTLLTDICRHLQAQELKVARWQCSDHQRTYPRQWWKSLRSIDVIAIDGAERLFPGLLPFIRLVTRLLGKGLIVTLHRSSGFGATIPVSVHAASIAAKVAALTGRPARTSDIEGRLQRHDYNARELLFEMYMEYEDGLV